MLINYYRSHGPVIEILFESAKGIKVESTRVFFRGVTIGVVKRISLSSNQQHVVVRLQLDKSASNFARKGAKYSLVTPEIGFQGVSGLDTLIDGTYLEALPGNEKAPPQNIFEALNSSSTDILDKTSTYILITENAESVSKGDPVTYRGIKIGAVTKLGFSEGAKQVVVQINVDNGYAYLIRDNTVFWRKSGIQADLGLFGSNIKVNSLDTLMNGGIELATPSPAGVMSKNRKQFSLQAKAPKDPDKWEPTLK